MTSGSFEVRVQPEALQQEFWLPFCAVFPVWFFRYSRALWLAVEHGVNPEL